MSPRRLSLVSSLFLLAVTGALQGCGSGERAAGGAETSLEIVVTAQPGAAPTTMTLTCDPTGGNHPAPQEACTAIAKADATVFAPVRKNASCTAVSGGPARATIEGQLDRRDIKASFSRQGGCELARWDELGNSVFGLSEHG